METIRLATWIDAPVERCFLLSLSIDLHIASARRTREKAIGGATSGLIGEGETVTFQGRHFGVPLTHTSRIEILRPYSHFRDVMVSGVFRRFEHDHHFAPMDEGTRMRDEVHFVAPWGPLGRIAAKLFLRRYLTAFLVERNAAIKQAAESEAWRQYLDIGSRTRSAEPSVAATTTTRWDGKALLAAAHEALAASPPKG
jgi:ligand-binding SRPBCC domain-containing protein